jgi:hypothetical protein
VAGALRIATPRLTLRPLQAGNLDALCLPMPMCALGV